MKARKSSPKSIRFNIKDFELGISKGDFESAQDMVDFLLKNYVQGEDVKLNVQKTVHQFPNIENIVTELPLVEKQILEQIREVEQEKIPKERDSVNGRKSWETDQHKKIFQLLNQLRFSCEKRINN